MVHPSDFEVEVEFENKGEEEPYSIWFTKGNAEIKSEQKGYGVTHGKQGQELQSLLSSNHE